MSYLFPRVFLIIFLAITVIGEASLSYARGGGGGRSGGSVSVRGYTKRDGTYVQPHQRSAPDGNFNNNWSTKGNINPYTGKEGTKTAPSSPKATGYFGENASSTSAPHSTITPVSSVSNSATSEAKKDEPQAQTQAYKELTEAALGN